MFFLIVETMTWLIFAIAFGAIIGWMLRGALDGNDAADSNSEGSADCEARCAELSKQLERVQAEADRTHHLLEMAQAKQKQLEAGLATSLAADKTAAAPAKSAPKASTETDNDLSQQALGLMAAAEATAEAQPATDSAQDEDESGALFDVDLSANPADNLQKISGVGPKLSGLLNELGVYHFRQIANFTEEDIARVNARLSFTGRIEREKWVEQAKVLAEGGETDFSKKKK